MAIRSQNKLVRGTFFGKTDEIIPFRYGLALRDHDIDVVRIRSSLVNRYPLMDVSR